MTNFKDYSKYYNLIYKNKDYNSEVKYILNLIPDEHKRPLRVLDLGCGTGRYDFILSNYAEYILGVDLSSNMIRIANDLKEEGDYKNLEFVVGNAQTFKSVKPFNLAISLFHVLSYQNTNEEVLNYFKSIRSNLNKDSIFIFDYWYSPGVNNLRPENRESLFEDEELEILRIAKPIERINENIVEVQYSIKVHNKRNDSKTNFMESHHMRHFSTPEIKMFVELSGFEFIDFKGWMNDDLPGINDWASVCIVRAK